MGLLAYNEKNIKDINTDNRVELQLERPWKIRPAIVTFPLYCRECKRTQSLLYIHTGSCYGQVGSCRCEFCGSEITVEDHDNVVDSIRTAGTEVYFTSLYLLDWKYVKKLEMRFRVSVENALRACVNPYGASFITVHELCDLIEEMIPVKTDGTLKFRTQEQFALLPEDINRWIELLYRSGLELPPNCILQTKINEGDWQLFPCGREIEFFADYPVGCRENPFDINASGSCFAYLTNRKQCLSYLGSKEDFSYQNNGLHRAMPMGYTDMLVMQRSFVVDSDGNSGVFEKGGNLHFLFCREDQNQKIILVSQKEILENASGEVRMEVQTPSRSMEDNIKKLYRLLKSANEKMGSRKITLVAGNILEKRAWH
ncbi:MAG: hypothetical protein ACI4AQ_01075 [Lachnospiraceae bacterium]